MDTGKIFAQVLDPIWRKAIIDNICAIERTIPSFWTLFEDLKLLKPSTKAITMPAKPQGQYNILEALRSIFNGSKNGQHRLVRQDEENYPFHTKARNNDCFASCYRQLWTYAVRRFPEFLNGDSEEEAKNDAPHSTRPKSFILYQIVRLAIGLAFRTRYTKELGPAGALDKLILDCLIWIVTKGASLHYRMAEARERPLLEMETPLEVAPSLATKSDNLDLEHLPGSSFEPLQIAKPGLFIRWLYDHKKLRGNCVILSSIQRALFRVFFSYDIGSEGKKILQHH